MTSIAYRNGIVAADSRETLSFKEGDGYGDHVTNGTCTKLFDVRGSILAVYGESAAGLIFVDWWRRGAKKRRQPDLAEHDFGVLVLAKNGELMLYSSLFHAEQLEPHKFYAFGSGSKAVLGALWAGASAIEAVTAATHVDPWSALPVQSRKWKHYRS